MRIPASLRMATLFPCCAIRVNLPALPCRVFEKFEKAFVCSLGVSDIVRLESSGRGAAYGGVDDGLVAGIVVDVDGDAAQGRHLSSEVVESRVVLAFGPVSGCVATAAGDKGMGTVRVHRLQTLWRLLKGVLWELMVGLRQLKRARV